MVSIIRSKGTDTRKKGTDCFHAIARLVAPRQVELGLNMTLRSRSDGNEWPHCSERAMERAMRQESDGGEERRETEGWAWLGKQGYACAAAVAVHRTA